LEALDRLCAAATECSVGEDPGRDLVVIAEDEVSLLEAAGPTWAALGEAIRAFRARLPLRSLDDFGFPATADNPLEEPNSRLRRIGGGVEAWAFASLEDGSVYKFYQPREEKRVGSAFGFRPGDETLLLGEARLGDYRELLEKLLLIHALGGMATEVLAVTPEGIVVAKQTLGEPLPQGEDMSGVLPAGLIEIPSRFLRANRDHPRLFFLRDRAFPRRRFACSQFCPRDRRWTARDRFGGGAMAHDGATGRVPDRRMARTGATRSRGVGAARCAGWGTVIRRNPVFARMITSANVVRRPNLSQTHSDDLYSHGEKFETVCFLHM